MIGDAVEPRYRRDDRRAQAPTLMNIVALIAARINSVHNPHLMGRLETRVILVHGALLHVPKPRLETVFDSADT